MSGQSMKIGLSVTSSYPGVDGRTAARWMVERARAARMAGLDSLFVGDHHVTPTNYLQNAPILGRMLAEWGSRPAGALFLLPLWNPVLLAEQVATLACINEGPFVLQCALGGDRRQSLGMGVDPARRVGMFETALATLRALWAGEEVTLDRYWPVQRARIAPLPPEPVEVWIGAQAPAALNRTARLAEGWLAMPSLTPVEAGNDLNRYRQACAEHGRTPQATAIRRDIFIGATREEVARVMEPYVAAGYRGFPPDALVCGTIEEVADQFRQLHSAGFSDIIVRNISAEQHEALATIERLGVVRELLS